MKEIRILVAAHRKVAVPQLDIYLPIQVGAKGKKSIGFIGDDSGENISNLNPYYSELTAVYWAWKNLDVDYIGLDHYRRYFSGKRVRYKKGDGLDKLVITQEEVEKFLTESDILVPTRRRYYIESLYSHYGNTLDIKHLEETRDIIEKMFPSYSPSFDKVMKQTWGYMFNMFIMKQKYFQEYCEWLFPILFELEKRTDLEGLSPFQARFPGRVSELLFNVWLDYKQYKVAEVPFFDAFEVNWFKKGLAFLQAKFFKKKYEKSF